MPQLTSPFTPLGPECRDHAGRPTAPVITCQGRTLNVQGIEQGEQVQAKRGLLADPVRLVLQKARCPVAAQVGHDDPPTRCRQPLAGGVVGVYVIGKPVQKHHHRPVGGSGLQVGDVESTGGDMFGHPGFCFGSGIQPGCAETTAGHSPEHGDERRATERGKKTAAASVHKGSIGWIVFAERTVARSTTLPFCRPRSRAACPSLRSI